MKHIFRALWIILLAGTTAVEAGNTRTGLWANGSFYGTGGDWKYDFQPMMRIVWGTSSFNQSLASLGFGKTLKGSWEGWLGAAYQLTDQDAPGVAHEYRIWEEIDWQYTSSRVRALFRNRLESRKAEGFSSISNRFRERVTLIIPLQDPWRLVAYDEVFFNLNRTFWVNTRAIDQNRVAIGLEYPLTTSIRIGAGYLYRTIFSSPVVADNILQFNLLVNIDNLRGL